MKRWIIFFAFSVLTVIAPGVFLAANVLEVSNEVTITAVVPEQIGSLSSSGGGTGSGVVAGGSGTVRSDTRALIQIEGFAFPNATIQLTVNGLPSDSWFAEEDGSFSRDFRTELTGTLVFSFSAHKGSYWSSTTTVTLPVEEDQILDLGLVLLSPVLQTSDVDRLAWDGYSIPDSEVTVWVKGEEQQTVTASSVDGAFSFLLESGSTGNLFLSCQWEEQSCGTSLIYVLPSSQVTIDQELAQEDETTLDEGALQTSEEVAVSSNSNALLSDLNEDGRVNYVDFGLMREAYLDQDYYALVDLDLNGRLNLVDFSLLAYQWTIP